MEKFWFWIGVFVGHVVTLIILSILKWWFTKKYDRENKEKQNEEVTQGFNSPSFIEEEQKWENDSLAQGNILMEEYYRKKQRLAEQAFLKRNILVNQQRRMRFRAAHKTAC